MITASINKQEMVQIIDVATHQSIPVMEWMERNFDMCPCVIFKTPFWVLLILVPHLINSVGDRSTEMETRSDAYVMTFDG